MTKDFIEILKQCVSFIGSGAFFGVLLGAFLLGVLCWFGCSRYTRLWHRRFHVRPQHHLLCAFAAALTMLFTVLFYAVGNLQFIANEMIDEWSEFLVEDNEWNQQTFEEAYYSLKESYPSAFVGVPSPDRADSYIPFNNDDMIQQCVETYVEKACDNFSTQHPFLDRMLRAKAGVSEEEIEADIKDFFRKNPGVAYPAERAVEIATEYIRKGLLEQSPKTVWKTRLILVFLFLAVQMIPFGTITYCANEDLKKGKYKDRSFYQKQNDY